MTSLLTPHLRFLHVPKTGGIWVTAALAAAGVPIEPLDRRQGSFVAAHAGLEVTADYADRFTLAYVRHPLEWWRSFWAYRMRTGWIEGHEIDSKVRSADFNEFASLVIERLPGHFTNRATLYIGPPQDPISYIGRFESLLEDLVRALRQAGEPFDEQALRAHPPENVSDYQRFPALYQPAVARALASAERSLIERFYADDPVPSRLLAASAGSSPGREPVR